MYILLKLVHILLKILVLKFPLDVFFFNSVIAVSCR
jgi:hypothetical protein